MNNSLQFKRISPTRQQVLNLNEVSNTEDWVMVILSISTESLLSQTTASTEIIYSWQMVQYKICSKTRNLINRFSLKLCTEVDNENLVRIKLKEKDKKIIYNVKWYITVFIHNMSPSRNCARPRKDWLVFGNLWNISVPPWCTCHMF